MNNIEFFIKYLNNQPVSIDTAYNFNGEKRGRPLTNVSHLVAAFQALPNSPLASAFAGDLTLHLPDGAGRSALVDDCFAITDSSGTTLRSGLALARLNGFGLDDLHPLIIKSSRSRYF